MPIVTSTRDSNQGGGGNLDKAKSEIMFDSSRSGEAASESESKGEEKQGQDSKEYEEKILKQIEEYDMKNY